MKVDSSTTYEEVCKIREPRTTNSIYGITEWYGFGKYIRQYGWYPAKWPLHIYSEHSGPAISIPFTNGDVKNCNGSCIFFHSPSSVSKWKEKYKIPVHGLYSPFVFYRKSNNINVSYTAKGTLAYPAHTIPGLDIDLDIDLYITQLKSLPEEFQPVSISMHYHDIKLGKHHKFLQNGMDVYTAGYPDDDAFPEKFYEIIRQFKYTTSNYLGSYLFYSVEMGIPFFLYGNDPVFVNSSSDEDGLETFNVASEAAITDNRLKKEFSNITTTITKAQKQLVEYELGILNHNSRLRMSFLLYKYLAKALLKRMINSIKQIVPQPVRRILKHG